MPSRKADLYAAAMRAMPSGASRSAAAPSLNGPGFTSPPPFAKPAKMRSAASREAKHSFRESATRLSKQPDIRRSVASGSRKRWNTRPTPIFSSWARHAASTTPWYCARAVQLSKASHCNPKPDGLADVVHGSLGPVAVAVRVTNLEMQQEEGVGGQSSRFTSHVSTCLVIRLAGIMPVFLHVIVAEPV